MEMQYLGAIVAIIFILFIYFLTVQKEEAGMGKQVKGIDIWVDRTEYPYPLYVNRAKEILESSKLTLFADLVNAGYDVKAIWAIIMHETGSLSDPLARENIVDRNNILGIEADGEMRSFNTIDQCLAFFKYIIESKPDTYRLYMNAFVVRMYGEQFLTQLNHSGYNSTPEWLRDCLRIYYDW